MYIFAYALILIALFAGFAGALWALYCFYSGNNSKVAILENCNLIITGALIISSFILLFALITYDFSVVYVANYTDFTLPIFYRLTAFWAGQAGSLLFWALALGVCAVFFQSTKSYNNLDDATKAWFWIFFFMIMAFFGLLLSAWNNPFITQTPIPQDGRGLNPLLQNPGMILHPPLLFLGYGGFTIPACLALAQAITGKSEHSWLDITRPFILLAWSFLTAGIILGGWWSYMELGWGGYWAWDPVENASLLPWLIATACLHTMLIQSRTNKLIRLNTFLINLTTITAFFATYIVRGNVVDSLHAFGDVGIGIPLFIFVAIYFIISIYIAFFMQAKNNKGLEGIESREGFLVFTCVILIVLCLIILFATLSPVISNFISGNSSGLTISFYNQVCLPLFIALTAMLAICPWLNWKGGIKNKSKFFSIIGVFIASAVILWFFGFRQPMSFIAASASFAAISSILTLLFDKTTWNYRPRLAAYYVHLGVVLMVLGVAFSGPYKQEAEVSLAPNASVELAGFTITLKEITDGKTENFEYLKANLDVNKAGSSYGILSPERRIYYTHSTQAFSEADTIFSMGSEIYAVLLGLDKDGNAVMRISTNPLVNWIWLGAIIMCIFPFIALTSRKKKA